ncbi:MAG: DNA methyltransferase [Candidatus Omnitrophota bacterium]
MKVEKIKINQINPAPYNPRVMESVEFEKLKQSIVTFGFQDPIIWNQETGYAVGGNMRLRALIDLGFKEVDVVVVNLSLAKEKLFNIALNKISGKFDLEKLAPLLEELSKMPDINFELSGFDVPELSEILDRYNEAKEDDFDTEKVVESIVEPVTRRGDIIELGNHIVLCGDASNPEDLNLLMGTHSADMLDVDVPYNVSYMGGDRPNSNTRPKKSRQWEKIYSDDMPQPEYEAWMRKVFGNVKEHLKLGAAAYFWQGHRQISPMYQILLELGFHISSIICWLKESAAISYGDYSFRSEHALYGWLEGAPHYFAGKPGCSNVWEVNRDPTKQYIHPTQKPVELAAIAIRNSSKIGGIVLDCCIGGGGVLIAAESLNRRCFGMEISPKYCDALTLRYIAYVGQDKVSEEIKRKYSKGV